MPHVFSRGLRQARSQGGVPKSEKPTGPLLLDWFRLAAAAMMTMAVVKTTTMEAGAVPSRMYA